MIQAKYTKVVQELTNNLEMISKMSDGKKREVEISRFFKEISKMEGTWPVAIESAIEFCNSWVLLKFSSRGL